MANRNDTKSAEELEREIDAERHDIARNVEALQNKLSVGGMVDDLLHSARSGGGAFGSNLGRTVSENPIPVVLIGAGLAWLMTSRNDRSAHRHDHDYGRGHGAEPFPPRGPVPGGTPGPYAGATHSAGVTHGAGATHGGLGERAHEIGEAARHRAGSATSSASGTASHAAGTARESAESAARRAREAASSTYESAGRGLSQAGGYVSHTASSAGEYLGGAASSAARSASYAGRRVQSGFEELMEDQPLVVGALAFAFGAAVGSLIPNTRTENELFGEQAERLRGQAYSAAQEEADKARRVAEAALHEGQRQAGEAWSEAERRAPSAREAVEEGERRAGEAARRVGDAARQEAERQRLGEPGSR